MRGLLRGATAPALATAALTVGGTSQAQAAGSWANPVTFSEWRPT
ncbi:hypothetical protein [Streptomyces sp. DH24]|nr:hypothetical protein [Streptomyces sp. DH24]MDG9720847.1 hypothetical protein [Streptomyces sp. DH24]